MIRPSRLVNRNIPAKHGRTSMRLEPELWAALTEICLRERIGVGELVQVAQQRFGSASGRTSAVRVFALSYFRAASTEGGHAKCGHGTLRQRQRATLDQGSEAAGKPASRGTGANGR